MATIQYVGDNGADGTVVFKSATASTGAFYGATPVVQPTAAAQSAITAGATLVAAVALLIEIRSALVTLGLIKGS
jgi:hypothetical protein